MSERDSSESLAILANPAATLGQTLRALEDLEVAGGGYREATIGLSSNATVELLGAFLRKQAFLNGVRLQISHGGFDDPLGDVDRFQSEGIEQMVLLTLFDNLLPSFEAQVPHAPVELIKAKEVELRARHRLIFQRASGMNHLFLCSLHRIIPSANHGRDQVDEVIGQFNQALREEASSFSNIRWIDTEACLSQVGKAHAFDFRFYFSARAPYSTQFINELARRIVVGTRGFGNHFHKVLVLDCDNTLWGGIIGEDLIEGIKLDPFDHPGNVFWRVQHELVSLEQSGVLLCLCSKNNPEDVAAVFTGHPSSVLRGHHFAMSKVNWKDKATNLREIAQELNLGLDSFVFLDDSAFECESVRAQLPSVRTFQVPPRLSDYPRTIQEIKEIFLAGGISSESLSKTGQYRQMAKAKELKAEFESEEAYLASLSLKLTLSADARASLARISELTMKSNQFNLRTRRYSEADILKFMDSADTTVYSVGVSDRFGDAGLTGILIMRWLGSTALVDSFLLSCRIIGRGIEHAVWRPILEEAVRRGCHCLAAEYIPTPKNASVLDFYQKLGLSLIGEGKDNVRSYQGEIGSFTIPETPWIEVIDG